MTVSAISPRVEYNGDGSALDFTVTFPFLDKSHVKVFINGDEVQPSAWTALVDRPGKSGYEANAKIWLDEAPDEVDEIVIYRETPRTQNADWRQNQYFTAETPERSIDRMTMILQEIDMWKDRMVAPPEEETNPGGGPDDPTHQWIIEARPGIITGNSGSGAYLFKFGTWDAATDDFIVDQNDTTQYTAYEMNAIDDMQVGKKVRVLVFENTAGDLDYRIRKYMDYTETPAELPTATGTIYVVYDATTSSDKFVAKYVDGVEQWSLNAGTDIHATLTFHTLSNLEGITLDHEGCIFIQRAGSITSNRSTWVRVSPDGDVLYCNVDMPNANSGQCMDFSGKYVASGTLFGGGDMLYMVEPHDGLAAYRWNDDAGTTPSVRCMCSLGNGNFLVFGNVDDELFELTPDWRLYEAQTDSDDDTYDATLVEKSIDVNTLLSADADGDEIDWLFRFNDGKILAVYEPVSGGGNLKFAVIDWSLSTPAVVASYDVESVGWSTGNPPVPGFDLNTVWADGNDVYFQATTSGVGKVIKKVSWNGTALIEGTAYRHDDWSTSAGAAGRLGGNSTHIYVFVPDLNDKIYTIDRSTGEVAEYLDLPSGCDGVRAILPERTRLPIYGPTSDFSLRSAAGSVYAKVHDPALGSHTLENLIYDGDTLSVGSTAIKIQGRNRGDVTSATIKNCVFVNQNDPSGNDVHGCYLEDIQSVVIEDCVFRNVGVGLLSGAINYDNRNHDLYLVRCDNIIIRRCVFINCSSNSIKMQTCGLPGSTISIENCAFIDSPYAIGTDDGALEVCYNVNVTDCLFQDIGGKKDTTSNVLAWGIVFGNVSGGSIKRCRFVGPTTGNEQAIRILSPSSGIVLEDNDLTLWDGRGIYASPGSATFL